MAPLHGEGFMVVQVFSRFAKANAWGTMLLRGGIVAVNFSVMIGLAAGMGLAAFGELAVIWGLAMVAGTALSGGAPLLLLRRLTDGHGMSLQNLWRQIIMLPISIGLGALLILHLAFPAIDWMPVLLGGAAINLATCLASIMRALGSMHASMALRDAGPQVALGLSGLLMAGSSAATILLHAALWLGLICIGAGLWCGQHRRRCEIIRQDRKPEGIAWALWGTSLLGMVLAQIDIVVGGSVMSATQVGLYAVLRRLANLIALPVSVATWVSAGPVSAAFGSGDICALRRASAKGSQIALIPGLILLGVMLAALPVYDLIVGQSIGPEGRGAFAILALGAFAQVVFASSFTVATLCGAARSAALSRAVAIALYLAMIGMLGDSFGVTLHAAIYAGAVTAGTAMLWWQVRQRLGVDTSVAVIRGRLGVSWKPS